MASRAQSCAGRGGCACGSWGRGAEQGGESSEAWARRGTEGHNTRARVPRKPSRSLSAESLCSCAMLSASRANASSFLSLETFSSSRCRCPWLRPWWRAKRGDIRQTRVTQKTQRQGSHWQPVNAQGTLKGVGSTLWRDRKGRCPTPWDSGPRVVI